MLDGLGARQTAQRLRRQFRRRDILLRLKDAIREDRIILIAAGVAFHAMLALVPGHDRGGVDLRAGLTDRQAEVLGSLANGLSNAEIAARLSLSAKTVEHHVSALVAKLGVGSRQQGAAAARHPEVPRPKLGGRAPQLDEFLPC